MRDTTFQTSISVPSDDVEPLMEALADSGFVVLDTGDRITTESALEGEATLQVLDLPDDREALEHPDARREPQDA